MPTENTYQSNTMPAPGDHIDQFSEILSNQAPIESGGRADDFYTTPAERREAIEEAHANGDYYYDGTTTIDGQEVQVWLLPDGSTVYYDADSDTVVDVTWSNDDDKEAAMEAAHDGGDAFYDGTTEVNGDEVQVWIAPDGMEVFVDPDSGEVVGIRWPDGQAPEYVGQVMYDGDSVAVYEYPNGTYGLVDDGETVLMFDDWSDVDVDTETHEHLDREVYVVPAGPPSYDSIVYDAATGQPIAGEGTGSVMLDGAITHYQPPGEDYVVVIDQFGNVLGTFELPPDEDWSILGVTKYEDGTVTIDLGGGELTVDLDSDGGIWFTSDGLGELIEGADWVGSVEAGLEWDEQGIELDVAASVAGVGDIGYTIEVGQDGFDVSGYADIGIELGGQKIGVDVSGEFGYSDGKLYAGGDVGIDMNVGLLDIEANVGGYFEVGPDGIETEGYWDGKVGALGFFVEGGQKGSMTLGEDGLTMTYNEYRGAGHDLLGSVRGGGEVQLESDGTVGGTKLTGHVYGSTNDTDGDETGVAGRYLSLDGDGDISGGATDALLDTGVTREDYDRHAGLEDENDPGTPDGSADFDFDTPDFEPGDVPGESSDASTDGPSGRAGMPGRRADADVDLTDDITRVGAGHRERPGHNDGEMPFGSDRPRRGGESDDAESTVGRPEHSDGELDRPDSSGSGTRQRASAPPPGEEDAKPVEKPEIFKRRDTDAKTPAEEPEPDPEPTPKAPADRPTLFEKDEPESGPTENGPTSGPTGTPPLKPEIFTERLQDTDTDGDGVPDGRFDPLDPIGTDGTDLGDIAKGPIARQGTAQTADAGVEQAPGAIGFEPDLDPAADLVDDITAVPAGPTDSDVTMQSNSVRIVGNNHPPTEASVTVHAMEPEDMPTPPEPEPEPEPEPMRMIEPEPIATPEPMPVVDDVAPVEAAPPPTVEAPPLPEPADDWLDEQG